MSEYADRDVEGQGAVYIKHVSAMTGEDLHFKSDIAAELAHRDIEILQLKIAVFQLKAKLKNQCTECPLNRRYDDSEYPAFLRRQAD